jgi:gluconokinase
MPSAVVIGLDLGTTTCKAVALSAAGEVLGSASSRYPLYTPKPEQAEQDVNEVWRGAVSALSELCGQLPRPPQGLCLSGAMHSLLPVGGDAPLGLAMTWADNRAADAAKALYREVDAERLYTHTGCPLHANYTLPRLRWLQEHDKECFEKADHLAAIKDWVLFKLTGSWATDWGMASTTGLLNLKRLKWDDEALDIARVASEKLPPLVAPREVVGSVRADVAAQSGLPQGLPVIAGGSDGGLANLGSGTVKPGHAVVTVGTSGAIRIIADEPKLDEAMRVWCYVLRQGHYFVGGAINNGGLVLDWVRRMFYSELSVTAGFAALLAEAEAASDDDLLLLPYLAGERSPHWNAGLTATLHGLTLRHNRGHIARAAMEGVAFCLADVWDALERHNTDTVRLTGGITHAPLWAQIVTDVLGAPLAPVDAADASAVGAAMLGHWALGNAPLETLAASVPRGRALQPDAARHQRYARKRQKFEALYQALWA